MGENHAPLQMICVILALVLFFLGSIPMVWAPYEPYHNRLIAAGLFFWVLSTIVH